jgi:hypothetical protein
MLFSGKPSCPAFPVDSAAVPAFCDVLLSIFVKLDLRLNNETGTVEGSGRPRLPSQKGKWNTFGFPNAL